MRELSLPAHKNPGLLDKDIVSEGSRVHEEIGAAPAGEAAPVPLRGDLEAQIIEEATEIAILSDFIYMVIIESSVLKRSI